MADDVLIEQTLCNMKCGIDDGGIEFIDGRWCFTPRSLLNFVKLTKVDVERDIGKGVLERTPMEVRH